MWSAFDPRASARTGDISIAPDEPRSGRAPTPASGASATPRPGPRRAAIAEPQRASQVGSSLALTKAFLRLHRGPRDRLARLRAAAIVVVALVAWLAPGSLPAPAVAAADAVVVRAGVHANFGRLALEWPTPVEVESERLGDRLILRFDRPFSADLSAARGRLGDYLEGAEVAADGRAAILRLAAGVSAELDVYDGRIVVVDLTSEAPARAAVEVRTGEHDGYARLVFDWAEPIEFAAEPGDQALRIRFSRPATIEAPAIAVALKDWLLVASATPIDGGIEVRLGLRPEVRAEVFRVGADRVVVDLYGPAAPPGPPASPLAGAVAPTPEASDPPAASLGPTVTPEAPTPIDEAPGSVVDRGPPGEPAPPTQLAAVAPAAGEAVGAGAGGTRAAVPATGAAATDGASTPARAGSPRPPIRLVFRGEPSPGGGVLGFAWSRTVGAAVLIRAGYLWTVFDLPPGRQAQLPSFIAGLEGVLGPGEVVDADGGIAIRFPLLRPLAARVERGGARWRVVLGAEMVGPAAVPALRQRDPDRLQLVVDEVVRPVRVGDPEVGDRLEFWPLRAAGRGLPRARRLVDLELLESAQGMVWRALADGVESVVLDYGIGLATPHGPTIAVGPERATAASPERPTPEPPGTPTGGEAPLTAVPTDSPQVPVGSPEAPAVGPLALADWGMPDAQSFRNRRGQLMRRLADQPPDQRAAARLDLARLFLGQAMAAETLAVLGVLAGAEDQPADQPMRVARQGLAGAAELLLGRLERATAAFDDPALAAMPEIALWRAVLAAAKEDWARAALELGRSEQTLESYPPRLQLRLGLPAALIALEAGRQDLARSLLQRLEGLARHPTDQARVGFMLGLAAARSGALREADAIWRRLEQSPHYETRVKAAYARVTMLLDRAEISPAEALARLGPTTALWRGHPWEATMLDGLARIHLQSGDPPGAIRTWRDLARRHPESALAAAAEARMRETFEATLLAEDGGALGAVRAYALYRDFPELVPNGARGVDLRRHLAGQLRGLELLEPAAQLLDQVIAGQAEADDRAATAAELAELKLARRDPEAALAVLDRHPLVADGALDLRHRRRLLRAEALGALDRPREALSLLASDGSEAARRLAIEIAWQARDWPRVVAAIEPWLAGREAADDPLADADQALLLKLAIAHGRRGDGAALERLRKRFGPALRGQALEPAFLMATMNTDRPLAPDAVLALADAQLADVRRYLEQPTIRP